MIQVGYLQLEDGEHFVIKVNMDLEEGPLEAGQLIELLMSADFTKDAHNHLQKCHNHAAALWVSRVRKQ